MTPTLPDKNAWIDLEVPQTADLALHGGTMDDDAAYTLIMQEFSMYENWRLQNYDPKWNSYDALYFGRMQQKMWQGSTVPRSSLSNPISRDQVETALPAITAAIFGPSTDWFQVQAEPGVSALAAQAVGGRLKYLLDHCKTPVGTPARSEIKLAIRQQLTYGNGILHIKFDPELGPPPGRSTIEWVDTRDIFIDPGCPSSNIDESRSVIRRYKLTVDELDDMRHMGMNIPPIEQLRSMGSSWMWSAADQTKQIQQNLRGITFTPGSSDYSPNPNDRFIEVLVRYSKNRIIWMLDRKWVCYNGHNPYGFIPFVAFPCLPVPGSFYGQSIPELVMPFQRYTEALRNGRLDEIALNLHPPRGVVQGIGQTPSMQAWRPGAQFQVPSNINPKDAVGTAPMSNVTAGISEEVMAMEISAEKATGINTVMQGIPRPGNANRTAGGMAAQSQGGQLRLSEIVQNIEDYGICPMLDKLLLMEKFHQPEWGDVAVKAGDQTVMAPAAILKQPIQFHMTASTKMLTREKLAGELPMITQSLTAGPLITGLQQIGKTIDWDQYFKLFQDAMGITETYQLVREMNDQEKQALQQPPPQVVAQQQAAEQANQVRIQMGQMKSQTDLQTTQIKAQADVRKGKLSADAQITETDAKDARHILNLQQTQQDLEKSHQAKIHQLQLEHASQQHQLRQKHAMEMAKHITPGAAKPSAKK